MQHKNIDLMKQINTYIGEFYISHDRTPSTTEIARKFGFSRSSAQRYLVAMNDNGMLSYADGKLKVDQMTKLKTDRAKAPLVGSVPCGELTYEEENVECVMTLPTEIFGSGPFYLLHASGDSMVDEGIEDGDLIVVRICEEAHKGDLVIALDAENRNTLKKFGGLSRKNHKAMLQYGRLAGGSKKETDQIISLDQLQDLERIFVSKIKGIVANESILDLKDFAHVFFLWESFDKEGANEYITSLFLDESQKLKYVCAMAGRWNGTNGSGWSFHPSNYSAYLSDEEIYDLIQNYDKKKINELSTVEQVKLASFVLNYQKDEMDHVNEQEAMRLVEEWKHTPSLE